MKIKLLLTFFLFLFLVACNKPRTKEDNEAFEAGQQYWNAQFTKCGESLFGVQSSTGKIVEFRSASGIG
ncbi:MAG TPA: hypothetical protein VLR90_02445, partial [Blastocatellia bacterium]|nr:hypothetical protein [Blastocatellia bacterium]